MRRLAFALTVLVVAAWAPATQAKTFTVNAKGDQADAVGDGKCDSDAITAGKQCTLRAAIQEANDQTDTDVIEFDIPGDGAHKIKMLGAGLPAILQPVLIRGYSQPGSRRNTAVKGTNAVINVWIDGAAEPDGCNQDGLTINASNVTVEGLAITNFQNCIGLGDGISINGALHNMNIVRGNFIGVKPDGVTARPNGGYGVLVGSGTGLNVVGGSDVADRNLISANYDGVEVSGDQAFVLGNLIGTDRTGKADAGNFGAGVRLNGDGNVVDANTIAFNGYNGVTVQPGVLNSIQANSIFYNDGLGIDLGNDGRTPNDYGSPYDSDSGANNLQNFPELAQPRIDSAGVTRVNLSLLSSASKIYTVRIFSGPPGTSQGKRLVGSLPIATDATGVGGSSNFQLDARVGAGDVLTATATDPSGNTSEFSDPRQVRTR